mmetsp:Transcript_32948/g.51509  ORF Transcript_32948/g.51509 Transcript_32948/m.51509 type:complete len:196 (-) Transcript_32948:43-630(-)
MYGNFGILPHLSAQGATYGAFSPVRSPRARSNPSNQTAETNFLMNMRHYLGSTQGALQYFYELFALGTSAYLSLAPISSLIPKEKLFVYSKKILFFGILAFLVAGIEKLLNILHSYVNKRITQQSESKIATVLYDFVAQNGSELSANEGDELIVLQEKSGWCFVNVHMRCKEDFSQEGAKGWIPLSYLRIVTHKL